MILGTALLLMLAPLHNVRLADASIQNSADDCLKALVVKFANGSLGHLVAIAGPTYLKDSENVIIDDKTAEFRLTSDKHDDEILDGDHPRVYALRIKTSNGAPWHVYSYGDDEVGMFAYEVLPSADLVDPKDEKVLFKVSLSACRSLLEEQDPPPPSP